MSLYAYGRPILYLKADFAKIFLVRFFTSLLLIKIFTTGKIVNYLLKPDDKQYILGLEMTELNYSIIVQKLVRMLIL